MPARQPLVVHIPGVGPLVGCRGIIEGPGEPTECLPLCMAHERSFHDPVHAFPGTLAGIASTDPAKQTEACAGLLVIFNVGPDVEPVADANGLYPIEATDDRHPNTATLSKFVQVATLRNSAVAASGPDTAPTSSREAVFLLEVPVGPPVDATAPMWVLRRIDFVSGHQLTWVFTNAEAAHHMFALLTEVMGDNQQT